MPPEDRSPLDREASERALEESALELLEESGVLAGLNLREVAERAGMNRGLVYHYFGSRQELLRAALGRGLKERLEAVSAGEKLPFRARMVRFLRTMISQRRVIRIASLLLLDNDRALRLTPMREHTLEVMNADLERGEISEGADLEALHASIVAGVYGYALYRNQLARESGVSVRELDERVAAVFDRMLAAFS